MKHIEEIQLPFPSGFCNSGWHEGMRAKDWRGNPAPVCKLAKTCPCDCHKELDRMFEMAGRERVIQDNPEYVPYHRTFWMPSDDPNWGLPEAVPDAPQVDDHLEVTESGRTRKGSLESAVQRIVLKWLELPVMERIEGLNVKEISERVYQEEGAALEKAPSLGAVGAVLDRWDKCGYVMLGAKPVRVIALTKDGKEKGLDWCKARAKKEGRAA
jgi:hypothetical protein